ncbi:MAG: phosphodiester glycosidase family protein [Clostridia bacterium]|nr:phosphodiester glycosidase family protein [Clostridia bacterium]
MKQAKLFSGIRYIKTDDGTIKAVARTAKSVHNARLTVGGTTYTDSFNSDEPYDKKTHVFYLTDSAPQAQTVLTFSYTRRKGGKHPKQISFPFGKPEFADPAMLSDEYNSRITPQTTAREEIADGVTFIHALCTDKNGAPVHVIALRIDSRKASLYVGTPDNGYKNKRVRAKVPAMIDAAVRDGVDAVAAVNADFFDIWGDFHPAGLCVKNGRVIANGDSPRPFIGIKKDGAPVITSLPESPGILAELDQAAAGLQMIVKDGKIFEWGPLEPFAYVRHPRTAAGIAKDGTILLLEIDGRIPAYSNGATLVDLAEMMIRLGADRAINLDGGGSSIVYTKQGEEFILRSNPADLFRPNAMLIRKEFNCLLVTKK